jgi:hypothetical protein
MKAQLPPRGILCLQRKGTVWVIQTTTSLEIQLLKVKKFGYINIYTKKYQEELE